MSIVFWITWGLTRWHRGKESACQLRKCNRCEFRRHRRCRFNPLGKREEPGGLQSTLSQRVRHDWACMRVLKKKIWITKGKLISRSYVRALKWITESVYPSYQHTLLPFDYLTHELFIGWGLLICSCVRNFDWFSFPNFCYFHLPGGL